MMDALSMGMGAGIVGLIVYLIAIAWGMVPIVFVFLTKSWGERFKALIAYAIVSAVVFGVVTGALAGDLVTLVVAIFGFAVYYVIAGVIVMALVDFVSEPIARIFESRT